MAIFRINRELNNRDLNLRPTSISFEFDDDGYAVTGRNKNGKSVAITVEGDFDFSGANAAAFAVTAGQLNRFDIEIGGKTVLSIRNLDLSFSFSEGFANYGGFLAGKDLLVGSRKANELFGFGGNDKLKGGGGRDELDGGTGRDLLIGGRGADDFIFSVNAGRDKVKDFKAGVDDLVFETTEAFEDLTLRDVRNGVLIVHEDGKVLLLGVDRSDLSDGDFLFG
ncbi:hypothetical protein SAMN05444336_102535 [Albimonas donghaensis]|uniref:Hemolysin-type calcium-binding repeat-containing protein n=1 Tax=Albimonas donghaensis TaxID=356660 RepID=A0A1H2WXV6_9RHOB|nr:hypothetical protein [Albimonas donghaensis]SDW85442.1 hypothetical protein SAMN05444336_102535 [Albimonas donghaensis]